MKKPDKKRHRLPAVDNGVLVANKPTSVEPNKERDRISGVLLASKPASEEPNKGKDKFRARVKQEMLVMEGERGTSSSGRQSRNDRFRKPATHMLSKLRGKVKIRTSRFGILANLIVCQLYWAKEARRRWQAEMDLYSQANGTYTNKKLDFNLSAFQKDIQGCGPLSPETIASLKKPSYLRIKGDLENVAALIRRLRCFDKYSQGIKNELCKVLYYEKFEDGRLILRQGHPAYSFYFIISGKVSVERIEMDRSTGGRHIQKVAELSQGNIFGELALLHKNARRSASIISKGTVELIRLDGTDYSEFLNGKTVSKSTVSHESKRTTYMMSIINRSAMLSVQVCQIIRRKEWAIRAHYLTTFQVFKNFRKRDLIVLNSNAKMETYSPNQVILSETSPRPERVFFIASGNCNVVMQINLLKKRLISRQYRYLLPPVKPKKSSDNVPLHENETIEMHHLIICQLGEGDYFNVGESLEGIAILSVRKASNEGNLDADNSLLPRKES